MGRRLHQLRRALGPILRPVRRALRYAAYVPCRWLGRPAGRYRYVPSTSTPAGAFALEVRLGPAATITEDQARAWCAAQTLDTLSIVAFDADGGQRWQVTPRSIGTSGPRPGWFAAPAERLPEVPASWAETALFVAAAEDVDAVVLAEGLPNATPLPMASDLLTSAGRAHAIMRHDAYRYDPSTARLTPDTTAAGTRQRVKVIEPAGVGVESPNDPSHWNAHRRGPYRSARRMPPVLDVGIRDVRAVSRPRRDRPKPAILVLFPFFAYGGVEQMFYEVLSALSAEYTFILVTLAPHGAERGDRRADFARVSDHLYSLGDVVHPAAMFGILSSLIEHHRAEIVFNANGTTLFYALAPQLRQAHPHLRIIDQLYDHRVGYIQWYDDAVRAAVDTCVASNHPIASELIDNRGWPAERVPVVWHCGRRDDAYPSTDKVPALRQRLRSELGYADHDVIFLTAARMNAQKRPLDLVRLALRMRDDTDVAFLVVGGGELEGKVDQAIATAVAQGARIRRLPFRDDVPSLAVAADVGCLVSAFEGLPVFMMECFQAGRPFLGTDTGDMGAVLRDTGAGVVVDQPGDLDALEAAVRTLRDPRQRAHAAAAAVDAAALFSVDTCAARYRALFEVSIAP